MEEEIVKKWKSLGEGVTRLPCPRCGVRKMRKELENNALSRRVDLYICPDCGTEESLEDFLGARKPLKNWFLFSSMPDEKQISCKFCGQNPVIGKYGYLNTDNEIELASGGYAVMYIGVNENGQIVMRACGEDYTDDYFPKYCPECGRDLRERN